MKMKLANSTAKLDGALNNTVYCEVSLPMAVGLKLENLQGPFQPMPLYNFLKLCICLRRMLIFSIPHSFLTTQVFSLM